MEGSLDFLDVEGEWHFDPKTRVLYIVPPSSISVDEVNMSSLPLLLTQTDCILKFIGKGSEGNGNVEHIRIENLRLAHTSASFFLPHEESSGGDYAVARSAAVFMENAPSLEIRGCDLHDLGGNGVFLSNSVHGVVIRENHFQRLGTSGVLVVGRTGI